VLGFKCPHFGTTRLHNNITHETDSETVPQQTFSSMKELDFLTVFELACKALPLVDEMAGVGKVIVGEVELETRLSPLGKTGVDTVQGFVEKVGALENWNGSISQRLTTIVSW
jgi:hypothetical protein